MMKYLTKYLNNDPRRKNIGSNVQNFASSAFLKLDGAQKSYFFQRETIAGPFDIEKSLKIIMCRKVPELSSEMEIFVHNKRR